MASWAITTHLWYLWSLICVNIRLSSYDDNQILWLSVFNDCQHAAFHVVLSFPCLVCVLAVTFNLVVGILLSVLFYPQLSTFTWRVRSHPKKDLMLATEFIWLSSCPRLQAPLMQCSCCQVWLLAESGSYLRTASFYYYRR